MGLSQGNSGKPDPFSDGGHGTGTDSAAINAALWELSKHGQHAVSVNAIAAHAALVAGWSRAEGHLNFWHEAGGCKGRLPSGKRFRPDRSGDGETASWSLVEVPPDTVIRRPDGR